jgi:hypothetical protein
MGFEPFNAILDVFLFESFVGGVCPSESDHTRQVQGSLIIVGSLGDGSCGTRGLE